MKIVTYLNEKDGDLKVEAMTLEEHRANGGLPDTWHDFIWQYQPSKEAAITRHDDALDAFIDDLNAGRPTKDTY